MRILRTDLTTRCTFTAPPDGVVVLFVMVTRPRCDTAVVVAASASTGSDELETKDNPMSRYELYARRYPLLPLKNVVIFPRNVITLLIGRTRSISAIEEAWARDRRIVVTAHRIPDADEPRPEDLYSIGTIAEVLQAERQQGGNIQVALEGINRVRIGAFDQSRPFFSVAADELREPDIVLYEARVLITHVQELATKYAAARNRLSTEMLVIIQRAS